MAHAVPLPARPAPPPRCTRPAHRNLVCIRECECSTQQQRTCVPRGRGGAHAHTPHGQLIAGAHLSRPDVPRERGRPHGGQRQENGDLHVLCHEVMGTASMARVRVQTDGSSYPSILRVSSSPMRSVCADNRRRSSSSSRSRSSSSQPLNASRCYRSARAGEHAPHPPPSAAARSAVGPRETSPALLAVAAAGQARARAATRQYAQSHEHAPTHAGTVTRAFPGARRRARLTASSLIVIRRFAGLDSAANFAPSTCARAMRSRTHLDKRTHTPTVARQPTLTRAAITSAR